MGIKKLYLLGFILIPACAMPPKTVCTDLSHLESGRFVYLDEDKEFERQQGFCRNVYDTPMNKGEFHRHFAIGKARHLNEICTCENGYVDRVKFKTDKRPISVTLPLSQFCREVGKEQNYLSGIEFAVRDLKTFKPNHWKGPTELTRDDGAKACTASKSN